MTDSTRRRWWRTYGSWLALAAVVVGALAWATLRPSAAPSAEAQARSLTAQLRCIECQGLSVADSRTTTAEAMKTDVRRRIAAGETDAQIRAAYVDRYGEFILLEPSSSNRALWLLPILIVGVGAAGIAFVVVRNARRPKLIASDDDRAIVQSAREETDA
jgi:cytochrome c-type biogenesis protein CcmH